MRASDIETVRQMIKRRNALLHFLKPLKTPGYVSIILPSDYMIETGTLYSEGSCGGVVIDGENEVLEILDKARACAIKNIATIDKQLAALGVTDVEPTHAS